MYEYKTLAECEALAVECLLAGMNEAMERSGQSVEIDERILSDFACVAAKVWVDEENGYDSIGYIAHRWGIDVSDLDEGHETAEGDSLPLAAAPSDKKDRVRVSDVGLAVFAQLMTWVGKDHFDLFRQGMQQGDVRLGYLLAAIALIALPTYVKESRKTPALPSTKPADGASSEEALNAAEQAHMLEETVGEQVKAYLASRPIV